MYKEKFKDLCLKCKWKINDNGSSSKGEVSIKKMIYKIKSLSISVNLYTDINYLYDKDTDY